MSGIKAAASAFLFFLLGAAPHVLMQNSHPQQSPQTFYPRIYITLLFQLKRPKKNMQSMKNAPIYRSAEIMQFVCELFNALAVFYTNSRTFGSEREFPKHKYLRTKSSRFFLDGWEKYGELWKSCSSHEQQTTEDPSLMLAKLKVLWVLLANSRS